MRTKTIVVPLNATTRDYIEVQGNKRYNHTCIGTYRSNRIKGLVDVLWRTLDPAHVRELRRALQEREAELVQAGFLEVEE